MIDVITKLTAPAALCDSSTVACWLREAVVYVLEISLLAWLILAALSVTLLFPVPPYGQTGKKPTRPCILKLLPALLVCVL